MFEYFINNIPISDEDNGIRVLADSHLPASSNRSVEVFRVPNHDGVFTAGIASDTGTVKIAVRVARLKHESFTDFMNKYESTLCLLREAKTITYQQENNPRRSTEVVSAVLSNPEITTNTRITVQATFTVQPYWVEQSQPVVTAVPLAGGLVVFSEFGKCSGKLVDAVVRFRGPFTRVVLSASNGTGLTVVGAFTQTDYVFVDLRNLRAWKSGRHDDWQASGSLVEWDYSAGGMLALEPEFEGGRCRYAVTVDCEGVGETSVLSVRSRKWYL